MLSSAESTSDFLVNISVFIKKNFYFINYLSHANTDVAMQSSFEHYLKRYIPSITKNWGRGWKYKMRVCQSHQEADTYLKSKTI